MAMITCPKCGRLVSEKAICCPGCGESIEKAIANTVEAPMENQEESTNNNQIDAVDTDKDLSATSEIREREISNGADGIYVSKGMIIAIAIAAIAVIGMVISLTYATSYKKALMLMADNSESQNQTITENNNTDDSSIGDPDVKENNADTPDKVTDDKKAGINQNSQKDDNKTETEKEPDNKEPSGTNGNKNIVFSDDYIVDLDFEITKIEVKKSKELEITYKVTNNESFPVEIHTSNYQYFDDVAVKKDWSELQNPVAAGKSGICTVEFYGSTIKSTGITKIGTYTLEMYSEEENGATHPFEVIFEDVNIELE